MAGIDIIWRLLFPLRRHFRRIRFSWYTTRAQLFTLNVILTQTRLGAIALAK
jgi:hypothetical protein